MLTVIENQKSEVDLMLILTKKLQKAGERLILDFLGFDMHYLGRYPRILLKISMLDY